MRKHPQLKRSGFLHKLFRPLQKGTKSRIVKWICAIVVKNPGYSEYPLEIEAITKPQETAGKPPAAER